MCQIQICIQNPSSIYNIAGKVAENIAEKMFDLWKYVFSNMLNSNFDIVNVECFICTKVPKWENCKKFGDQKLMALIQC